MLFSALKKKIIEKEESLWDMKKIHNFLKLSQISLSPYIWAIKKKKKLHGESCMSYFIYFLFYERIVMCEFGKL